MFWDTDIDTDIDKIQTIILIFFIIWNNYTAVFNNANATNLDLL